jgi:hypothetical protein
MDCLCKAPLTSQKFARMLVSSTLDTIIMRTAYRQYMKAFIPAMFAYVLVLFASVYILKKLGPSASIYLRIVLSLAPVLPIVFVCRALLRYLRECDELERQIDLEALAMSCLCTGLIFISLGFLAGAKIIFLDGAMVAIWVFPCLFGLYGVAKAFIARRYR